LDDAAIVVKDPQPAAGRRILAVPPHVLPVPAEHLDRFGEESGMR
jgi:hypothetical protein